MNLKITFDDRRVMYCENVAGVDIAKVKEEETGNYSKMLEYARRVYDAGGMNDSEEIALYTLLCERGVQDLPLEVNDVTDVSKLPKDRPFVYSNGLRYRVCDKRNQNDGDGTSYKGTDYFIARY
jgi:hypothetical protein